MHGICPPRCATQEGLSGNVRPSGGSFSTVVEQADLAWCQGDSKITLAQGAAHSDGHRDDADGRLSHSEAASV